MIRLLFLWNVVEIRYWRAVCIVKDIATKSIQEEINMKNLRFFSLIVVNLRKRKERISEFIVLSYVQENLDIGLRKISTALGMGSTSVYWLLNAYKYHPHKLKSIPNFYPLKKKALVNCWIEKKKICFSLNQ